ncbi:Unknown protein, partial [Striga hermonthica]
IGLMDEDNTSPTLGSILTPALTRMACMVDEYGRNLYQQRTQCFRKSQTPRSKGIPLSIQSITHNERAIITIIFGISLTLLSSTGETSLSSTIQLSDFPGSSIKLSISFSAESPASLKLGDDSPSDLEVGSATTVGSAIAIFFLDFFAFETALALSFFRFLGDLATDGEPAPPTSFSPATSDVAPFILEDLFGLDKTLVSVVREGCWFSTAMLKFAGLGGVL